MIKDELFADFEPCLYSGNYNLLFGSGISLNSLNRKGEKVKSAESLRLSIIDHKVGLKSGTPLAKAYDILKPEEIKSLITDEFIDCIPEERLKVLTRYMWKGIYTLNVDDIIETTYDMVEERSQKLTPVNFCDPFVDNKSRTNVNCVHLHGMAQQSDKGYIFSINEYVRSMQAVNPWMTILGQSLSVDSYIVAGTSFNDYDLEYYLRLRTNDTQKRSPGPSFLIEPNPDLSTERDCQKYGLNLIKSTFSEFLEWLDKKCSDPPQIIDIIKPRVKFDNIEKLSADELSRFDNDFRVQLGRPDSHGRKGNSRFFKGALPTDDDLAVNNDIIREDMLRIKEYCNRFFAGGETFRVCLVYGSPGVGKSTIALRIAYEQANLGRIVFISKGRSNIDVDLLIRIIEIQKSKVILLFDGVADRIEQINQLLRSDIADKILIIAVDRAYRKKFIDQRLVDKYHDCLVQKLTANESKTLIRHYKDIGRIADKDFFAMPDEGVSKIENDEIAVACCRLQNDFKPLDAIVLSLWSETNDVYRFPYLCTALANRLNYNDGLRSSIVQSLCGTNVSMVPLLADDAPLSLITHPTNEDFVRVQNSAIADQILEHQKSKTLIFEAFKRLSSEIAPYVNRRAIINANSEALLAGRLFDADDSVKNYLGNRAIEFFESSKKDWSWSFKYWEQYALLISAKDLTMAISHAAQALAMAQNVFNFKDYKPPFTLTTYAQLLFRRYNLKEGNQRLNDFNKAFDFCTDAIKYERKNSKPGIHPYDILLRNVLIFLKAGDKMDDKRRSLLGNICNNAINYFEFDRMLTETANSIKKIVDRV